MNPNYMHTITLYNCLKAADSPDQKDHWYRHVIPRCFYKASIVRTDSGTSAGQQNVYTVRIPQSPAYRPYAQWVVLQETERLACFTMALDHVVILGECMEEVTGRSGNAAAQLMNRHKPDSFKVTAVSDNAKTAYARHYRLGG